MAVATSDHLDLLFAALADPTRRAILARLAAGEATVNEIAAPFDMTLPAVSKHLKVLERRGSSLAGGRRSGGRPAAGRAAAGGGRLDRALREFWEERFDRLDSYLATLQSTEEPQEQETKEEEE